MMVPRPKPGLQEPVLNVLPIIKQTISAIIAVILPSDLVFILEDDAPEVTELGRIPRTAVRSVDVVDIDQIYLAIGVPGDVRVGGEGIAIGSPM